MRPCPEQPEAAVVASGCSCRLIVVLVTEVAVWTHGVAASVELVGSDEGDTVSGCQCASFPTQKSDSGFEELEVGRARTAADREHDGVRALRPIGDHPWLVTDECPA